MPAAVVNNTVRRAWTYRAAGGGVLTGMVSPADVTLTLYRDTGTAVVAATETVAWTEIGSGVYYVSFTPLNAGYYRLELLELNASSDGKGYAWEVDVLAAGAAFIPAFQNAFCSQVDVQRWTQLSFSGSSVPTVTDVAGFAESRASELVSFMAEVGFSVTPTTVAVGSPEEDMLREANAIAAAADALAAKYAGVSPSKSDKAMALLEEYDKRVQRLKDYASKNKAASYITTPMSVGELVLKQEQQQSDLGLAAGISMGDRF